jgi:hypothetical protein
MELFELFDCSGVEVKLCKRTAEYNPGDAKQDFEMRNPRKLLKNSDGGDISTADELSFIGAVAISKIEKRSSCLDKSQLTAYIVNELLPEVESSTRGFCNSILNAQKSIKVN